MNRGLFNNENVIRDILGIYYINDNKMITQDLVVSIIDAAYENFKGQLNRFVCGIKSDKTNGSTVMEDFDVVFPFMANDKEKLSRFDNDTIIKTMRNAIECNSTFVNLAMTLKGLGIDMIFDGTDIQRDGEKIIHAQIKFLFVARLEIRK